MDTVRTSKAISKIVGMDWMEAKKRIVLLEAKSNIKILQYKGFTPILFLEKYREALTKLYGKNNFKINVGDSKLVYIYFIQCTITKYIKIGKAIDLHNRFVGIQGSCPTKLKILFAFKHYPNIEFLLHNLFKRDRLHGEWFKPSRAIEDIILRFSINTDRINDYLHEIEKALMSPKKGW